MEAGARAADLLTFCLVTFALIFPLTFVVLLVSHYIEDGNDLELVIDHSDDAKRAALCVEDDARTGLGRLGVGLPDVSFSSWQPRPSVTIAGTDAVPWAACGKMRGGVLCRLHACWITHMLADIDRRLR